MTGLGTPINIGLQGQQNSGTLPVWPYFPPQFLVSLAALGV